MRTLTSHIVNPCNDKITIEVMDEPGPGGANHEYHISYPFTPKDGQLPSGDGLNHEYRHFQNGAIAEVGTNGTTHEVDLAILIDRMRGFQYGRKGDGSFDESIRGKYACRENALALTYLEEAQMWLQKRTRDRMARSVEGTMKV